MAEMTSSQRDTLLQLRLRPHGAPVRGDEQKADVLALAKLGYVCDPHVMDNCLFTRITDAGRSALSAGRE